MRMSDWSSDVCSSDLPHLPPLLQIDEMRQNGSARAARQPRVQPYIHARDHVGDMLHALLQKRHDLIFALLAVRQHPPDQTPRVIHRRSEVRRVGKEWVSRFRSWWSPSTLKKQQR